MARVFTDGAESGSKDFWTYINTTTLTIDSSYVRSGRYSYRLATPTLGQLVVYKSITPIQEGWLRYAIYIEPTSFAHDDLTRFSTSGGSELIRFLLTDTKYIDVYINGSKVGTSQKPIPTGIYNLIEVHFYCNSTNGVLEIKHDGTLIFQYTGNVGGSNSVGRIEFRSPNISSITYYLDDLALNDSSGTEDNSWCGDGRVILFSPNANGDVTQLTASTGSNYQCVDEGFPANEDTDYVYSDVVNAYDLYQLTDPSIPSDAIIKRVWAIARAKKTVADAGAIQIGIKTNGTEYWSGNIDITTIYANYLGVVYTKNPYTNQPWTLNEVNNLQVGVKVR